MQQPCPRCGYVSDRPARFCRQCGMSLVTETETTSAETRNYESRRTSPPYPESQPLPGSQYGETTPETTRFYQPPSIPNYAPYAVESPRKSRAGMWTLIAFLSLLLVGGGMIGMVSYAIKSHNYANNQSQLPEDLEQQREQLKNEIAQMKQEAEQARQSANQAKEEARRTAEGTGAIPPLPPPPPPPASGVDLEKYKYPNATIDKSIEFIGNKVLNMRTKDSIGKVSEFYRKLLGEPMIESNDEEKTKVVFKSSGMSNVIISIESDDEHDGQLQIRVFRSHSPLPR